MSTSKNGLSTSYRPRKRDSERIQLWEYHAIFLWDLNHREYFQLLYVRSQNYAISWEIAISKNLDFHQTPIFVRVV
jgi:hypothetical protein